MEIIQVAMKMSDEAARGIADGTMVRHGGVVYRTTGGIVEHLDDVIVSTVAKEKPVDQASGSIISSVANHLGNR